jgi:hypothetical protein
MSREEMAQMIYQQQAQVLGAEAVREKFGEQAYEQLKARSAAEKFQDTLIKIQDVIGSFGTLLAPVLDAFASIVGYLAESKVAIAALVGISSVLAVKSIVNAVASIFGASFAFGGPLGIGIAAAGVAALYGAVAKSKQQVETMDDGVIPSGYGNTIIKKGKNTIALNNNDQTAIVAGTNLTPRTNPGGGGNDAMIQEFREMKNILNSLLAKDSNVYIDSNKLNSGLKTARIGIK